MSAGEGKHALTDAEQYEQRRKAGIAAGAAKRSENTRPRTLDEVRGTVRDAAVQLGRYAKTNRRPDFAVLARILVEVRQALTIQPWTRSGLAKEIRELERRVFDTGWRPDGSDEPSDEYREPWAIFHLTHDGLSQLQQAVADRVKAGALPAEAPPPPPPAGAIDFREASARLRARRADETRRDR